MAFGDLRGSLLHNYSASPGTGIATGTSTVANVAAGDLVVVVYGGAGAYTSLAFTCSGITCPITLMTGSLSAASGKCYVGYGRVAVGGTLSAVTASHSNSSADATIIASVFVGPFTNPPKDKDINHLADSTTPLTCPTTGTLAQAVELVIGAMACSNGQVLTTLTASNGTMADKHGSTGSNTSSAALSYQVTAATTAVIPAFAQSGTATSTDCATLSFKNGSPQQDLTAGQVSTTSTIYTPVLTKLNPLTAGRLTDADVFYAPAIGRGDRSTTAGLVTDTDTFLVPVVGRGTVGATASLYTDADTLYPATAAAAEQALVSWASVYALLSEQAVTGIFYSDPDSFYAPVVGRAAWVLGSSTYSDPDTVYAPTLGRGARNLAAATYSDPDALYVPVVFGVGAPQSLTPGLVTDPDVFYAPTRGSTVGVSASRYSDPDSLYAPALVADEQALVSWVSIYAEGGVAAQASLVVDPDTVYAPTVRGVQGLIAGRLTDPETFFAPAIEQRTDLQPGRVANVNQIYQPQVVAPGALQSLLPPLYTNPNTLFGTIINSVAEISWVTVYGPEACLRPPKFVDPESFYTAAVALDYTTVAEVSFVEAWWPGGNLGASLYVDADTFFTPEVERSSQTEVLVSWVRAHDQITIAPLDAGLVINSNIFFRPRIGERIEEGVEREKGARITGSTFSRKRWRELTAAWDAQRALEMQAAELRAKSRRRIKLDRAAKIAEHALYVAQAHDEIDVKKLRLALQAAASAAQSFQAMREAERVIAISQKMVEDEDDEEAALMLILSGGG